MPMFIAGRKGLKRDGTARLLMTGYGGFDVSMTPAWNARVCLVDGAGRMVRAAQPARRRRVWRGLAQAGMFEKKQNVFDDWFAAAEYLIDE